jgi:hypothetical protein
VIQPSIAGENLEKTGTGRIRKKIELLKDQEHIKELNEIKSKAELQPK